MKLKQANKQLLRAVIEPRKPGVIRQIEEACAAGADPNGICPDTNSSHGPVRAGSTMITHAIQDWSSRVVEKLLQCGADPNLADEHGWTPWMASTLVDESKRERIQELLLQFGVRKEGDYIRELVDAIYEGDVDRAAVMFKSERDLEIITTFRVDLVRHTIFKQNTAMLELLIQCGLKPDSEQLYWTIRGSYLTGADLFLRHGASPEGTEKNESLLMEAAAIGAIEVVQRLVESGADVNRYAWDNIEWTAAYSARRAGHDDIADWLTSQMDEVFLGRIRQLTESRDPKYQSLYENATAGEGLTTDAIVATLTGWNERYGVQVRNVSTDSITVKFSTLPEDPGSFYDEVEAFCPDVCEDKRALLKELDSKKTLYLWWD